MQVQDGNKNSLILGALHILALGCIYTMSQAPKTLSTCSVKPAQSLMSSELPSCPHLGPMTFIEPLPPWHIYWDAWPAACLYASAFAPSTDTTSCCLPFYAFRSQ